MPALPVRASPGLAEPRRACVALPCLAVPRRAVPRRACVAEPSPASPSQARPSLAMPAMPFLPVPSAPDLARPAMPTRAFRGPAVPCRSTPALSGLVCIGNLRPWFLGSRPPPLPLPPLKERRRGNCFLVDCLGFLLRLPALGSPAERADKLPVFDNPLPVMSIIGAFWTGDDFQRVCHTSILRGSKPRM